MGTPSAPRPNPVRAAPTAAPRSTVDALFFYMPVSRRVLSACLSVLSVYGRICTPASVACLSVFPVLLCPPARRLWPGTVSDAALVRCLTRCSQPAARVALILYICNGSLTLARVAMGLSQLFTASGRSADSPYPRYGIWGPRTGSYSDRYSETYTLCVKRDPFAG